MTTAGDLCERGFLPRELPPPFSSTSFGTLARMPWTPAVPQSSLPAAHNLFRWGALRRRLSIPNPLAFLALAREIEQQWANLQPIFALSQWSLSRPAVDTTRALEPARTQRVGPLARTANRAGNRYAVKADISRFYHSVYTHTLEWAAHSKAAVKQNRGLPARQRAVFWGRGLDDRHRDLQDRQSVGLPIGPDTSLVAAELLLARVDSELAARVNCYGMRYIDDYELCVPTLAAAESALAELQQVLSEYELALNPSKTKIMELPAALEASWTRALRRIPLRRSGSGQRLDYIDLFDTAFELSRTEPDVHVIKFAMGIIRHGTCLRSNWSIVQSLLLQAITVEPGVIREVLSELVRYDALGFALDRHRIGEALCLVVQRHAPLGHGSEVAWALWAHIQLGIQLDVVALKAVETMDDSVVALVALDAANRGLCSQPITSTIWNAMMSLSSLTDGGWLLAYEAAIKGWLPAQHLNQHPDFAAMQNAQVSFYNVIQAPAQTPINLSSPGAAGGGGGGGY